MVIPKRERSLLNEARARMRRLEQIQTLKGSLRQRSLNSLHISVRIHFPFQKWPLVNPVAFTTLVLRRVYIF